MMRVRLPSWTTAYLLFIHLTASCGLLKRKGPRLGHYDVASRYQGARS